jgi:hypothetical protein
MVIYLKEGERKPFPWMGNGKGFLLKRKGYEFGET